MYLLFLNSCIFEYNVLIILTIKVFDVFIYYFKTCLLLYPFYGLMIFILYNAKELKLSSRNQYK